MFTSFGIVELLILAVSCGGPLLAIVLYYFYHQNKQPWESTTKICPFCAEQIQKDAVLCRYCKKGLPVEKEIARHPPVSAYKQKTTSWAFEPIRKYAVFSGRARRKEYWSFQFASSALIILLALFEFSVNSETYLGFTSFIALLLFFPVFAVTVRRLHDVGDSGWLLLVNFIPYIGSTFILLAMLTNSQPGQNKYGPNPKGIEAPQNKKRRTAQISSTSSTTVIITAGLILIAMAYFLTRNTPGPIPSPTRTPRPTNTPNRSATMQAVSNGSENFPTNIAATKQSSCTHWSQVTKSMIGRNICVTGKIHDIRRVGSTMQITFIDGYDDFFLASGTYYYDVEPGDCIRTEGLVLGNTYDVPYIDVDEIYTGGCFDFIK